MNYYFSIQLAVTKEFMMNVVLNVECCCLFLSSSCASALLAVKSGVSDCVRLWDRVGGLKLCLAGRR